MDVGAVHTRGAVGVAPWARERGCRPACVGRADHAAADAACGQRFTSTDTCTSSGWELSRAR